MAADRANAGEALLKGGADIEAVDDQGRTALCIAAKYGALDCINVLNEYGANHFHRDDQGLTALEIAEQSVRPEAAAQLKRMQQVPSVVLLSSRKVPRKESERACNLGRIKARSMQHVRLQALILETLYLGQWNITGA